VPWCHLSIRYREHVFPDRESEEFPSKIELKQQALETAQGLSRTRSLVIPNWLDCSLEVTDCAGKVVFKLPFAEAVQAARGV
jgi:hypothetical protein